MEEGNNLFSKINNLEEIEKENNKLLLELLNKNSNNFIETKTSNDFVLKILINSKKYYRWLGSLIKFNIIKNVIITISILLIAFGIISTISTSFSFNIYSTFTLFENIYLVFIILNIKNILKAKYIYETKDLATNSSFIYNKNKIGMYFLIKEKSLYKIFRWISIISIICNVIALWSELGKNQLVLSTILELIFLLLILVYNFLINYFFKNYKIRWFEYINHTNNKVVIFISLENSNKILSLEEFIKEYPKLNK